MGGHGGGISSKRPTNEVVPLSPGHFLSNHHFFHSPSCPPCLCGESVPRSSTFDRLSIRQCPSSTRFSPTTSTLPLSLISALDAPTIISNTPASTILRLF